MISLEFQDAVFDGAAGAKFFFENGEERRFALGMHLQPRDDRHRFSGSAAFLEADQEGGGGGHTGIFSNKGHSFNAATAPGFPKITFL